MITEIAVTTTPVTDIKRARAFYEGLLGLKPTLEAGGGLWIEYDVGPNTFAIACYPDTWKPSADGTCIAFEVDDVDKEVSRLQAKGVPVPLAPMDTPVCRFAMVSDPDGNKLIIHKRKAK
jgi:predicted enzyme related to lactoylglutathione lyase